MKSVAQSCDVHARQATPCETLALSTKLKGLGWEYADLPRPNNKSATPSQKPAVVSDIAQQLPRK